MPIGPSEYLSPEVIINMKEQLIGQFGPEIAMQARTIADTYNHDVIRLAVYLSAVDLKDALGNAQNNPSE
jgi:hypothetical protein